MPKLVEVTQYAVVQVERTFVVEVADDFSTNKLNLVNNRSRLAEFANKNEIPWHWSWSLGEIGMLELENVRIDSQDIEEVEGKPVDFVYTAAPRSSLKGLNTEQLLSIFKAEPVTV